MSLHHLARHLATKGRGEDSVLIHMTPREVAGLQHLALASGGSLTINPQTGLPEAGFLSSILPMIAGAAATLLTGGAAAPVMSALAGAGAGAVTKGATSGDWSAGSLLGGALSGFGGAGVGSALGTAGGATSGLAGTAPTAELAASTVPGMTAADLGIDAIAQQSAAAGLGGAGAAGASAAGAGASAVLPATTVGVGANPAATIPHSLSAMGQGAKNVFTGDMAGFEKFAGNVGKYPAMAGAMGTMMNMQPEASSYAPEDKGPMTYKRTRYRPGEVNTTDPNKPYFVGQGFDPYETYTMAKGGAVPGYAAGGAPASTTARTGPLSDYIASLNRKLTSPISWSQERQGAPAAGTTQAPNVPPTSVGSAGGIQALYNQYMNGTLSPGMMNWISGMRGANTGTGTGTVPTTPVTTPTTTPAAPTYTAPVTTPSYTAPSYAPIYTPPAYTAPPADIAPPAVAPYVDPYASIGDTLGPFVDSVPATAPPATDTISAPATAYPELQDIAAFNPSIYNNPAPSAPAYEPPAPTPTYQPPAFDYSSFVPTYVPPAYEPPAYVPPTPAYEPPAVDTAVTAYPELQDFAAFNPPAYNNPAPSTPAYEPPAPAYEPPAPTPAPAYEPPAFDYSSFVPTYVPPAYEPPAYVAPAYEPPAPAYEPPAYVAPTYEPPAPVYEPPVTAYPELQDFAAFNPPAYNNAPPAYEPPAPVYEPPVQAPVTDLASYMAAYAPQTPAYEPPAYVAPAYEPPAYVPPAYEPPAPVYEPPAAMYPELQDFAAFNPPAYEPPAPAAVDTSSMYVPPTVDTSTVATAPAVETSPVYEPPTYTPPVMEPTPAYTAPYMPPTFDMSALFTPPTYTPPAVDTSSTVDMSSTYSAPAAAPTVDTTPIPSFTDLQDMSAFSAPYYSAPAPAPAPSYTSSYVPSYTPTYTAPAFDFSSFTPSYTPPVSAPVSTYTAPTTAYTPPSMPSYTSTYTPSMPSYTSTYVPSMPSYTAPTSTYMAPTSYPDFSMDFADTYAFASGGGIGSLRIPSLGGYSDGGRLLRGPGDGVSDDIPASIYRNDGTRQEARLADGEFVIDAQTVSRLGNGSTEAGAKKLYAMMDRIHAIRTRPGKNLNAERHLPA